MNKPIQPKEHQDLQALLGLNETAGAGFVRSPARGIWKVTGAAILLGGLVWWWVGGKPVTVYITQPATRGTLTVTVTATGSVQPTKKVDVSSELSGTVRAVIVDYNSSVRAGQVLAELETDKLEATLNSSQAKLSAAKAKMADALATEIEKSRDLARRQRLVSSLAISNQDLDQAQAAHDRAVAAVASALADVRAANADVLLNETNLSKASIRSPINGVILKRSVDPGQTVASTLQAPVLFSIAEDLKQMELQVDVDEADVAKVKIGQTATFGVDAFPDQKFPAIIRDVRYASETVQGVVTYKAVLVVDNSALLLRPGMTATADIKIAEVHDALLIPNGALRYSPPETSPQHSQGLLSRLLPSPPRSPVPSRRADAGPTRTVWTLHEGQPTQIKVVVGATDGRRTEVRSGELQPGDELIVDQSARK